MAKPFALIGALLLLAGCSATEPVAPEPSFAHRTHGCETAIAKTAGTPGEAGVARGCSSGQ
jgi:hypothetical protein